ncbi:MAG TPA: deoxyuridine 5'-triphosphate nucleotidohydrolase [Atopostipes sp.]|nr:deoxyuridine 5'-triphosphate nucleotidohydrolase [Atopostipes sp.]
MNHQTKSLKIKYFNSELPKLEYIEGKSDWIDLRASIDMKLTKGVFALIPLGVAMELPVGYEAHVVPRSSTFKNFGLIQVNSFGVIDNTYNGPNDQWFFPAYPTKDVDISFGDRICQFRIMENQPKLSFIESDLDDNLDRGGHGSTGKI